MCVCVVGKQEKKGKHEKERKKELKLTTMSDVDYEDTDKSLPPPQQQYVSHSEPREYRQKRLDRFA